MSRAGADRNRHSGTVMFLFKAMVGMAFLLAIIRFFAKTRGEPILNSCQMESSLKTYSEEIQRAVSEYSTFWLMCPKDISLRLGFEDHYDNETELNSTFIQVHECTAQDKDTDEKELVVVKHDWNSWEELIVRREVDPCSCALDCSCMAAKLVSLECYVTRDQEEVVKYKPDHDHDPHTHRIFGIYFVLMTMMVATVVLFYGIYKITILCLGEKRAGHTVLV